METNTYKVTLDGTDRVITITGLGDNRYSIILNGVTYIATLVNILSDTESTKYVLSINGASKELTIIRKDVGEYTIVLDNIEYNCRSTLISSEVPEA